MLVFVEMWPKSTYIKLPVLRGGSIVQILSCDWLGARYSILLMKYTLIGTGGIIKRGSGKNGSR